VHGLRSLLFVLTDQQHSAVVAGDHSLHGLPQDWVRPGKADSSYFLGGVLLGLQVLESLHSKAWGNAAFV
jgi:hypothetical protein